MSAWLEGYEVDGPRYARLVERTEAGVVERIVTVDEGTPLPTVFVQRATMRGRPWLRFVRKISAEGYWVTGHKTRTQALRGDL